jgi:hypothetical protein
MLRQVRQRIRIMAHMMVSSGGSSANGAWFKKCHFQVTPEIDRALMVKGFLVLGVTLI